MIHSAFHPLRVATLRPNAAGLVTLAILLALSPAAPAQELDEEPIEIGDTDEVGVGGGLSVDRIEITVFGGAQSGGTYLELPPIFDELRTFDTAANQILDFQGIPVPPDFRAPQKKIEGGPVMGATTTFYLNPNFGMQLYGTYATADVTLSGYSVTDPNQARFEYDRDTVSVLTGGGNMTYNVGTERKMKIWPYVVLGFGGLLNKFPETDDVGALYFLYGGGVSFNLAGDFRLKTGVSFTLFSWEQEEVSLDSTVIYPSFSVGITWRHEVPPAVAEAETETGTTSSTNGTGR